MASMGMDDVLRRWVVRHAGKIAVKTSDSSSALTYAELDGRASRIAAALARRGVQTGDRVMLSFGNTPDFFAALFGCWRGGFVAVPLDPESATTELQNVIEHAEPKAIIEQEDGSSNVESLQTPVPRLAVGELSREAPGDWLRPQGSPAGRATGRSPECPALLLYTSGTSGQPKAVLHVHRALVAKVAAIARHFGFDESFVSLCLLPTHFGHGLICNCLSTLSYGGTLIIAPPFNLDFIAKLWPVVEAHHVNTFSSVPTVVRLLRQYARRRTIKAPASLKLVTCASAPLWPEDIEAFGQDFGVPLLNCYGLTETSGWIACSERAGVPTQGRVGKPLADEIRVVNSQGAVLSAGERGELQVNGPSVMAGYYRNDALTQEVIAGGWFSTGDIGELDAAGAVYLHSRIKDLIIRAGKNIYPTEVDGALMTHPEVADACTIGLNDELLGESVAACVVRGDGASINEAALIAYARQLLAGYKVPQKIVFVDRIPKTSRGKVNRAALRSQFSH